jgi:hypothetical protein
LPKIWPEAELAHFVKVLLTEKIDGHSMIELSSDPFVLKPRNTPLTEADFRLHLNISWCRGVLFNVVALKNSIAVVEYDALLWSDDSIMFVEYKDSAAAYKGLSSRRVQQMNSLAKNIARGLGYKNFTFIVVVKGLEELTTKGGVEVLPLFSLGNYEPKFASSITEMEYLQKLMAKYTREGKEDVVAELDKLKKIFEMETA